MGFFGGGGGSPSVQYVPVMDNSAALKAAAKLEAEQLRKRKGMKATWLTGNEQGQEQTQKSELLGG